MFKMQISEQAGEYLLSALKGMEISTFSNMKRMYNIRMPTYYFKVNRMLYEKKKQISSKLVAVYEAHLVKYLCILVRVNSPGRNYHKQYASWQIAQTLR
jgi:hypothetical protein